MAGQPIIQASFNSGEWAPTLYARVDLAKYHSGAALLRNFFVDYRGGTTTRPGTKYVLHARYTSTTRLIPFQASFSVSYVLEFGAGIIRVFSNGAPVLGSGFAITGATKANPCVLSVVGNPYTTNVDVVFVSGVAGMTQLNGNYYTVIAKTANTITIGDLNGNAIDSTGFGNYTSGGTTQAVVLIATPYQPSEVFGIKYAQNVNKLVLCHPNHPPCELTLNSATSWSFAPITFGSTISAPGAPTVTTTAGAGSSYASYIITAVDANGQESAPSAPGSVSLFSVAAVYSNVVNWVAVTGAVSYNIYRAVLGTSNPVPAGAQYGFIGNATGTTLLDTAILADFSQCPPVVENPFSGAGIATLTLGASGSGFTAVPLVTFTGGTPTTPATASAYLGVSSSSIHSAGLGYADGMIISGLYGVTIEITNTGIGGQVLNYTMTNKGTLTSGSAPAIMNFDVGGPTAGLQLNLSWGISQILLTSPGAGYSGAPTVGFSGGGGGGASATAVLGAASAGNPTVPGFHQQRMVLAGLVNSPGQFNASQPAAYHNFNITNPAQADNAIQGTLVDGQLNTIKSMVSMPPGLIMLTDKKAWLLNGGSFGSAMTALDTIANSQAYNGISDLPPIVANYDILYVQAKSSIVRDSTYDFYRNIFTGTDISILSSHLFFSFTLTQWAWAEEPYKIVWAVRNDGALLSLTFVKEQEMIAWAHHDTQGTYQSVVSVTESTPSGNVDAVYVIVQRDINGQTCQYIERFVELSYPQDYKSSWQVDAGIQYSGTPATSFSGATQLAGMAVTGVADGVVFNTTVSATGTFTLGTAASLVTVGLPFTPQLQTLPLDLGEPTVQGKRKKVSAVTTLVANTLGLQAGRSFASAVDMQDLILGNQNEPGNYVVGGLINGQARTILDPQYDVFGQFCIQQVKPYPATILGVVPEIDIGDTPK